MISRPFRYGVGLIFGGIVAFGASAPSSETKAGDSAKQSTATSAAARGRGAARGTLPDPVLLDGSALPAEKKSEQGMLGEFELPGDDSRNGKVGGPQGQQGQSQQAMGLPQMGGGGGAQSQAAMPQGGAPGGAQNSQAGGAQSANQPNQAGQGTGGELGGPADPNAKAEGVQVGQLQTDPNAGGQSEVQLGPKPQAVAIGDSAMQIKTVNNAPGVVGTSVPAGSTQQMEKAVGGGKGGSGAPVSGKGGNATERGRAIPAGL